MAHCLELFFCVRRHRRSGAGGGRRSLRRGVDLRSGGGTRRRGAPRRGSGGRAEAKGGGRSSNCRSRGSDGSGPTTPARRGRFLILGGLRSGPVWAGMKVHSGPGLVQPGALAGRHDADLHEHVEDCATPVTTSSQLGPSQAAAVSHGRDWLRRCPEHHADRRSDVRSALLGTVPVDEVAQPGRQVVQARVPGGVPQPAVDPHPRSLETVRGW